ncbi:MAG TPA: recombinase [Prolixibacteraceae bacterium]|jgi:integrase|nr:recombinase [Prolixibacteraceae bacterium]
MATIKLHLDTRSKRKNDQYPVTLILHHGYISYISLGISVTQEQWNGKEVIHSPKAQMFNSELKARLLRAQNVILRLSISGEIKKLSQKELLHYIETNTIEPEPKQDYQVETHFEKYISQCKSPRTKEIYQDTLNKLHAFSSQLSFEDLNLSWLKSFDTELAKTCKTNTRAIHMRNIRAVFNDAINEDLVSQNLYPFRKFKIKKEKTIKRSLTADKLITLRDYPVEPYQEKYRDLFMLQFYLIGISIVDLLNLKTIADGRVEYIRRKTGVFYSIKVLPEAMRIIDKYRGKNYLLDVLDHIQNYKEFAKQMNEALKRIGHVERIGLGGKKIRHPLFPKLTSYYSRHSWATLAASIDIPIETISAALGHKYGSETTGIYIDFDRSKVDQANEKVLNLLRK